MTSVIGLSVLSQLGNLAFMRIWGAFTDRYSNKSVLLFSGPLFVLCILGWTFTTMPEKHFLTIPLLIAIHILMGVFGAGVGLASGNIGLKLAPREQAASYLTARNLVNSLLASAGPILGGKFIDFFEAREFSLTLNWVSPAAERAFQAISLKGWDFFFLFAFVIGLYAIHRLVLVKETGEVEEKVVMNQFVVEVRRTMRNFSSIEALRYMVALPFSLLGVKGSKNDDDAET
jgi:MFS family permease